MSDQRPGLGAQGPRQQGAHAEASCALRCRGRRAWVRLRVRLRVAAGRGGGQRAGKEERGVHVQPLSLCPGVAGSRANARPVSVAGGWLLVTLLCLSLPDLAATSPLPSSWPNLSDCLSVSKSLLTAAREALRQLQVCLPLPCAPRLPSGLVASEKTSSLVQQSGLSSIFIAE